MSWFDMGGDPDGLGWSVTLSYLIAGVLCWRVARGWRTCPDDEAARRERRFWFLCAGLLILLGINKELDVHDGIRHVLSVWSQRQGWYHWRPVLKLVFLVVVLIGGAGLTIWGWRCYGSVWRRHRRVAWGWSILALFVVGRASSVVPPMQSWFAWFEEVHGWGCLELIGTLAISWGAVAMRQNWRADRKGAI